MMPYDELPASLQLSYEEIKRQWYTVNTIDAYQKYLFIVNTPVLAAKVQVFLAKTPRIHVRCTLAKQNYLLRRTQLLLAKDAKYLVRQALARNAKLHPEAKRILLKDKDGWVLAALAGNPSLTGTEIRELFLRNIGNERFSIKIKAGLAINPNTPSNLIGKLFNINNFEIKKALCCNANTSNEVLKALLQEESKFDGYSHYIAKNRVRDLDLFKNAKMQNLPLKLLKSILEDYTHNDIALLLASTSLTFNTVKDLLTATEKIATSPKQKDLLLKLAEDWSGSTEDLFELEELF